MLQRVQVSPGRYQVIGAPDAPTEMTSARIAPPCRHRGTPTGADVPCITCPRKPRLKVFGCALKGACTIAGDGGLAVCASCREREPFAEPTHPLINGGALLVRPAQNAHAWQRMPKLRWSYGVTTVPERRADLLPRTLASLAAAGFDRPRLFVDGDSDSPAWRAFGLEVTYRTPRIRTHGNWLLALLELHIREPAAGRYAIFQDDLLTAKNLRRYLECVPYPPKSYLNLTMWPSNYKIAPKGRTGWYPAVKDDQGNQCGKGAVALVFDREAVIAVLASKHMQERCRDAMRGHRSVDGGIATATQQAGWREHCHYPSLVYHAGAVSSMQNRRHPDTPGFVGEAFDALTLLEGRPA